MRRTAPCVLALSALFLAGCSGGSGDPAASPSPTSPSASPTASPKPVAVATCPLTGKPPQKGQNVHRTALAVKIDNGSDARPQAGLDRADIVVEETVEGGLTRLFAIFQCDSAETVGPIRSARTSDSDLLRLLKTAVFGYSGANRRVNARINTTPGAVTLSYDNYGGLYHRSSSRPAPHNVYSSTSILLKTGKSRSKRLKPPPAMFAYAPK